MFLQSVMRVSPRRWGEVSLTVACLALLYYTAWVILLPFVEPEYLPLVARSGFVLKPKMICSILICRFFPPPWVGLALPLLLGASLSLLLFCRAAYLVRWKQALHQH